MAMNKCTPCTRFDDAGGECKSPAACDCPRCEGRCRCFRQLAEMGWKRKSWGPMGAPSVVTWSIDHALTADGSKLPLPIEITDYHGTILLEVAGQTVEIDDIDTNEQLKTVVRELEEAYWNHRVFHDEDFDSVVRGWQ